MGGKTGFTWLGKSTFSLSTVMGENGKRWEWESGEERNEAK